VVVLPGHVETFTAAGAIWPSLKAGTQIIGAANAGGSSAPTVNLNQVAASIALNVADVTVHGLNIVSASVLTAGIVITAAGVTLSGCFINSTGALAANVLIQVTGAANFTMVGNHVVNNSTTGATVNVTAAASTNLCITDNLLRNLQATSGGIGINVASTAGISGMIARNFVKSATNGGAGGAAAQIVIGAAANTTVGVFENYAADAAAAGFSGVLSPVVLTDT
jgi:hypothetical protein